MQQELALRGHRTIAVDLPGRGAGYSLAYHLQDLDTFATEPSPVADVTAAATIGHVVEVVPRVRAHGPVVLVGHSYGGLVITGVANAIPDQLDRLVYISAQCPVSRHPGAYLGLPEWSTTDLLTATGAIMVESSSAVPSRTNCSGTPIRTGTCVRTGPRGARSRAPSSGCRATAPCRWQHRTCTSAKPTP